MTLGQAVRRVVQLAPRDTTGTLQQDLLTIRDWVVDRHRTALDRWTWSFLQIQAVTPITTVASTDVYTLAADYREWIDFVNITTPTPLYPRPIEFLDRLDPSRQQTGPPRLFSVFGGTKVKLYPIPDGVYTVNYRYNRRFPDPVVSSDLLAGFSDPDFLIDGALAKAYAYLAGLRNSPQLRVEAQVYEQTFEAKLSAAISTDRPNVILPSHPDEQEDGMPWFSADDYRVHDFGFAVWR